MGIALYQQLDAASKAAFVMQGELNEARDALGRAHIMIEVAVTCLNKGDDNSAIQKLREASEIIRAPLLK